MAVNIFEKKLAFHIYSQIREYIPQKIFLCGGWQNFSNIFPNQNQNPFIANVSLLFMKENVFLGNHTLSPAAKLRLCRNQF